MHSNEEIPTPFEDIIALVRFDDIGPAAQVGFAAEHPALGIVFFPKITRSGVCLWEQVIKWDYMGDVLPGYTLFDKHKDGEKKK